MTALTEVDGAAIADTVAAIGRTGARAFEVGYLNDDPPHRWYATAIYQGAKVSCDNQDNPLGATLGLYAMIAAGGTCAHCGRPVAVEHADGLVDGARMRAGTYETRPASMPRPRYCIRGYDDGWPSCANVQAGDA